jgi:hypothetical protein
LIAFLAQSQVLVVVGVVPTFSAMGLVVVLVVVVRQQVV